MPVSCRSSRDSFRLVSRLPFSSQPEVADGLGQLAGLAVRARSRSGCDPRSRSGRTGPTTTVSRTSPARLRCSSGTTKRPCPSGSIGPGLGEEEPHHVHVLIAHAHLDLHGLGHLVELLGRPQRQAAVPRGEHARRRGGPARNAAGSTSRPFPSSECSNRPTNTVPLLRLGSVTGSPHGQTVPLFSTSWHFMPLPSTGQTTGQGRRWLRRLARASASQEGRTDTKASSMAAVVASTAATPAASSAVASARSSSVSRPGGRRWPRPRTVGAPTTAAGPRAGSAAGTGRPAWRPGRRRGHAPRPGRGRRSRRGSTIGQNHRAPMDLAGHAEPGPAPPPRRRPASERRPARRRTTVDRRPGG